MVKFRILVTVTNEYGQTYNCFQDEMDGTVKSMQPIRAATDKRFRQFLLRYAAEPTKLVIGSYFGKVNDKPDQWSYGMLRGAKGRILSRHGYYYARSQASWQKNVDSEREPGTFDIVHRNVEAQKYLLHPQMQVEDWVASIKKHEVA